MTRLNLLVIILFVTISGCSDKSNDTEATQSLKGTSWTSQFYHYSNHYQFQTDSTGQIERGQVAWSCPVDTVTFGVSGSKILYDDPKKFTYQVSDSILVIEYTDNQSNENHSESIFYFHSKENRWVSKREYTYGKEYLENGDKKEKLTR